MAVQTEPVSGKWSLRVVLLAKASAIKAALFGHQRYTVALPTRACAATASMVRSEKPFFPRSLRALRRMETRACSLRGRPGDRFARPLPRRPLLAGFWRITLP